MLGAQDCGVRAIVRCIAALRAPCPASFTARTGIKMFFADLRCPWQRSTNDDSGDLPRQYFPREPTCRAGARQTPRPSPTHSITVPGRSSATRLRPRCSTSSCNQCGQHSMADAIGDADLLSLIQLFFTHLTTHRRAGQVIGMRAPRDPAYLVLSERMCVLLEQAGAADPPGTAYRLSNLVIGSALTAPITLDEIACGHRLRAGSRLCAASCDAPHQPTSDPCR